MVISELSELFQWALPLVSGLTEENMKFILETI